MQRAKTRLFSLKWDFEILYYSTRGVFSFHQSKAVHIGKMLLLSTYKKSLNREKSSLKLKVYIN